MLLVGAGEIAGCLATMATFSGFSVTVCEPRSEYWTARTLALTHDPKLDDLALPTDPRVVVEQPEIGDGVTDK